MPDDAAWDAASAALQALDDDDPETAERALVEALSETRKHLHRQRQEAGE